MPHDNTNRGAIWPNKKKREGKQDPDFTGSLDVDGAEFWVSAWRKKDDAPANAPSLSFTVKPKEQKPAVSKPRVARPASADMGDDFVPF